MFVCFPILKGMFLQVEPESLGWTLSPAKVAAQITGVQEVSDEIIPAPQLTQQVPGLPLLTPATGQKAKRMPTL